MVIAVKKTETMLMQYASERGRRKVSIPLKAVSYDVEIVSGLAIVTQKRVFRNEERQPIEATLTFPVAYESVVSDVRAIVGGRTLVGVAKAKHAARKVYENAMDDGKATVLHEELMRGLHMVSAGNIAPGDEIIVKATCVAPLSMVGGIGRMRIPLTIGAIYGTSPLIDSDDILADGEAMDAAVSVRGADGVRVNGTDASSVTTVRTSSVIDIAIPAPSLVPLRAKMPSGSWAGISFEIPAAVTRPLDVDLMLDTSGSMAEGANRWKTKWQALLEGLGSALKSVDEQDVFRFWTFSSDCILRGAANGIKAAARLSTIPFDNMGTELAEAVHKVARSRSEANILLVTDGKSYREIDFDVIRKSGARFTVVLIGRSAFESRVAHLAALTGGQMFVVDPSDDVAAVVSAALLSMRSSASSMTATENPEASLVRVIGGLRVSVAYSTGEPEGREVTHAAAYAASLAVSALPAEAAGKLAEETGIVSHLTSIVMVDYEGGEVDGIAVTRKVGLAESDEMSGVILAASAAPVRASAFYSAPLLVGSGVMRSMNLVAETSDFADVGLEAFGGGYVAQDSAGDVGGSWRGRPRGVSTKGFGGRISKKITTTVETTIMDTRPAGFWGNIEYPFGSHDVPTSMFDWTLIAEVINCKNSLAGGFEEKYAIVLSARAEVVELAQALGKDVLHVALALIASKKGNGDRIAERIARKVLDGADPSKLAIALAQIPG
jgi:hypothetical protein